MSFSTTATTPLTTPDFIDSPLPPGVASRRRTTAQDGSAALRVGLMTDTYLPVSNGVTHMVSLLARQLAAWGHEAHVFTFAPTSELRMAPDGLLSSSPHLLRVPPRELKEQEDGVFVHHAPALPLFNSGYYLGMRYPLWMKQLLREMDIVHVHHPLISGRLAQRIVLPKQPLVFTNHTRYDIYSHYVQRVVPFVPTETVGERLTRRAAQFANACDKVIAPSASLARLLQSWNVRSPIEVISNGIELERFHRAARSSAMPNGTARSIEYSINGHRDVQIVYLGRLAPEKNCETLLDAFALTLREAPHAHLTMIGDGPAEADLKEYTANLKLEDHVTFCGALPYDEVPQALARCDVFASASVSEVHPLTFIEAMACGLPCVGTRSPGVVDTIIEGRNGWLAEAQSQELARALTQAITHYEERRQFAANALNDSASYAIETTAREYLRVYQQTHHSKQALISA